MVYYLELDIESLTAAGTIYYTNIFFIYLS